jgi:hypothetical protein
MFMGYGLPKLTAGPAKMDDSRWNHECFGSLLFIGPETTLSGRSNQVYQEGLTHYREPIFVLKYL